MTGVKLVLDDEVLELDLSRFMLTEAIALEEQWGMTTDEFLGRIGTDRPPLKVVLAMVWLARVRANAARDGVPFAAAAAALPPGEFDVNLQAFRVDATPEPENPTPPATRTPATRTTRATSASKRPKRG